MDVEVRRVETTVHETGVAVADRVEVTYELGATIEGAWVRFASVTQNAVDVAVAATPAASSSSSPPVDEGPTMADVTPTPAPQVEAASAGGSSA